LQTQFAPLLMLANGSGNQAEWASGFICRLCGRLRFSSGFFYWHGAFLSYATGIALSRLNDRATALWHNVHLSDEYPLTLRQADQARTDFAAIEGDLQFIMGQLARCRRGRICAGRCC
jgi:hypothetical protein